MGKEEEGGQKMKGGRSGKKAKGMKKKKNIRFVPAPQHLPFTNRFCRKTSADKAQEEAAAKEAVKIHK